MSNDIAPVHPPSVPPVGTSAPNPFVVASPSVQPLASDAFVDLGLGTTPVLPSATSRPAPLIPGLNNPGPTSEMANNFGSAAVDIDLLEKEITAKEQARRDQMADTLQGDIAGATPPKPRRARSSGVEPDLETDFSTLDEPVWDTIKRDLRTVGAKFGQVLVPRNNQNLLRDWDLWGPLFICVAISLLLQSGVSGKGPRFTEVFALTFFGSCVITLNIKLLGGNISFFQSLCVLGYCLLPPGVSAVVCMLIETVSTQTSTLFALRLLVTTAGFLWATYASMAFLSGLHPQKRRILSIYPIFLFYFVISWMIISHSSF